MRPMLRRVRSGRADHERGQGLVEFALVLPLLAFLLFGLLDLGRAVYISNATSEGAREGARWGSVQGRSSTEQKRMDIAAKAASLMVGVPNANVKVRCERDGQQASACHTNDTLVVEVRSDVDMLTPVVSQLVGRLKLSATSTVTVLQ